MEEHVKVNIKNTKKLMKNINKERYRQLKVNRYDPTIKMIEEYIEKDSSILDIGIREGAFLDVLKNYGYTDLWGTDIYKEGVENASKNGHTTFVQDAQKLNIDHKFKAITISHVLEHCPDMNKVVDNMYNHLEMNGIVYVEVPKEKKGPIPSKHAHYFNFSKLDELASFFPHLLLFHLHQIYQHQILL